MLQSIGNSVIFDIGCLVSAVRQDQGIRVAHCDAVSGELQHKKIVRAVAECIGVFDRNPKAVCQKPDSGCFAKIFLSQFPGLVFMYETQKMFICKFAESFHIRISRRKSQKLVKCKMVVCFGRVESQIFYYNFCFQLLNSFRNST